MKFSTLLPFVFALFAAGSIAAPVTHSTATGPTTPEQKQTLDDLVAAKVLPDSYDDELPPYEE
jgi:hypothetical protein